MSGEGYVVCVCGGEGGGYETNTATEEEACRIVYMRLPSEVLPTVAGRGKQNYTTKEGAMAPSDFDCGCACCCGG